MRKTWKITEALDEPFQGDIAIFGDFIEKV